MNILNLTPHEITLCGKKLPSSGVARVAQTTQQVAEINGIPVNKLSFGQVMGLPEERKDTIYIVSRIVAEAVKGQRNDVFIVDKTVRNEQGQIVGCEALAKI
jgi:hypothetical protein